jgi:predicted enzyme related to lactoylglutathione lyase
MFTPRAAITFLYYDDLEAACNFYAGVLGLPLVVDQGFCKIHQIAAGAYVGLVDAEHGTHKPAQDKPVILSFVTDDPDAIYQRLQEHGTPIFRPLETHERIGVRGFMALDPGGYTLEFEAFLDQPRNAKMFALLKQVSNGMP